jgi:hypothetical protein
MTITDIRTVGVDVTVDTTDQDAAPAFHVLEDRS